MGRILAKRVKCTIIYATETGKSEGFARTLYQIFKHAFDAKLCWGLCISRLINQYQPRTANELL
ncbi:hypothetical protein CHS0354_042119 [Potamilus streckersoni]|uniref:nitric-oxide synthase (NADPH) n=1 Tax=Potamilus streckersoni TaxID=2493646 RepID=A0AAE0TNX3_9BIVA|nr:hypothetical protein CHS0354_042119 [Potamilus streckersoni]